MMQFNTVRELVGWAFQMSEAVPVKMQKFTDTAGGSFGELTPAEQRMMADDILAKIGRLPDDEQAALAAMFTGDPRAIKSAAWWLSRGTDVPLFEAIVWAWVEDGQIKGGQEAWAARLGATQQAIGKRKVGAMIRLDKITTSGFATIEVQVLDLVRTRLFYKG